MMNVVVVVVTMMVVHGCRKRGARGEQQQRGNDGNFLHGGDLYLDIDGA
jgi:hypothetical protein